MPSYWWKCGTCKAASEFPAVTNSKGMAHFIWDELVPSNWDQACLVKKCPVCGAEDSRITYEFPRKDKVELTLVRAVGVGPFDNVYVPMMWETYPDWDSSERLFDFKYVNGRSIWGLNRAAVFTRESLGDLFALYKKVSGVQEFP